MTDEMYSDLPAAAPDESLTLARPLPATALGPVRVKRKYERRVPLPELAARRAASAVRVREFRCVNSWIEMRRAAGWRQVCQEFLPLGFVVSPDALTAALDVLLPDGTEVTLPATAISEQEGAVALSQWAAFRLIDMPDVRATGFWLREVIGTLRDVRRAPLRYVESEERSSRHLVKLAEKATGKAIRREETALTISVSSRPHIGEAF